MTFEAGMGSVTTQDIAAAFSNAGAIIGANNPGPVSTVMYPVGYTPASQMSFGSLLLWGFALFALMSEGRR